MENDDSDSQSQECHNIPRTLDGEDEQQVKFPKRLRHKGKGKVLATIYKFPDSAYRLYWRTRVDGKPCSRTMEFRTYAAAKKEADKVIADLAKGKATGLSPGQTADALNALEALQRYYQATGKKVSLRFTVSDWCENAKKLDGRTLTEATDGFLTTVANVKRKDIKEAVEEFIINEEPRTKSINGQRAQLSAEYHYNRAIQLRRFAATFPNTALCDLTKSHLDTFINGLSKIKSNSRNRRAIGSAKTRNDYRANVRQFLSWAVRKDYLAAPHRLFEADSMRPEHADNGEIGIYTPHEFAALLEAADDSMRPMIAIGGLGGLRTAELLKLDWADVWRVPGHIEVTSSKSKTRQRRLVEVAPALAAWLETYRNFQTGKLWKFHPIHFQGEFRDLCENAKVDHNGKKMSVTRKANGLRHSFCSYHFALHGNENLTAKEAGNSPQMVHSNYKGLVTKAEAEKWFKIMPAKQDNIVSLTAASSKAH